ncbi:hypothetical protein ABBQ38_004780 [Trebouxia sp. C0009 RCD-2024]
MAEHIEMHSYPELVQLATRHHAPVLEQACDCFANSLDEEGSEALGHHLDMFSEAQTPMMVCFHSCSNANHQQQVARHKGEPNSPMEVDEDSGPKAAGGMPNGGDIPALEAHNDVQAQQQGEYGTTTVLQPEALPKCSTSAAGCQQSGAGDDYTGKKAVWRLWVLHPEPPHSFLYSVVISSTRLLAAGSTTAATAMKLIRFPRLW